MMVLLKDVSDYVCLIPAESCTADTYTPFNCHELPRIAFSCRTKLKELPQDTSCVARHRTCEDAPPRLFGGHSGKGGFSITLTHFL